MSSQPPQQAIFSSIHYLISSSIAPERAEELSHVLDNNGAMPASGGVKDSELNTVISNSNKFEGWEELASREGVSIVTPQWVERSLVLGKQQMTHHYSADPAMVFSGITACAADLPAGDLEVLSAGITALGGQWRIGLTKEVTHLFALNTGSAKYATAMHFQPETGVKVIVPHWFDDAVRLGFGGLPTKSYEWPEPEAIRGVDLSVLDGKGKGKGADLEQDVDKRTMYATAALFTPSIGQSSTSFNIDVPMVDLHRSSPSAAIKMVWAGRKFIISRSLELYGGRRETVQMGIERQGGKVVRFEGDDEEPEPPSDADKKADRELSQKERVRRRNEAASVKECDILITRWRYGRAYVEAARAGKAIGTLAWLFHVQSTGKYTNPLDQLLHYPLPKRPIEGFSNHVLSVTNYTGEAREYLKKLISVMGAKFTPSMTGSNTVLIAAQQQSTKAIKAQAWSIPVVNHTWIEDCFVQWRNLTTATEKYIVFPPGIDFSDVLGTRGVGVGKGVEVETEDLAALIFEEDEVVEDREAGVNEAMQVDGSVQDEQEDIEMQMPGGTAASAKEVEKSLQGEEEVEDVGASRKEQLVEEDGMELEVVPSSTAARLGQSPHRPKIPRQTSKTPVTPRKSPLKPVVYSSKAKLARRKFVIEENEEEEGEGEEATQRRRKPTAATQSKKRTAHADEDYEEVTERRKNQESRVRLKAKSSEVASAEEDVIELSDSDGKADLDSDGDEEEDPAPRHKPKTIPKAISPTKLVKKASSKKTSKRKPTPESLATPESEDYNIAQVGQSSKPVATSSPSKRKPKSRVVRSEDEETAAEAEIEEVAVKKIGKPTGKPKLPSVQVAKTTNATKTALKGDTSSDDDTDDRPLEKPVKNATIKAPLNPSPRKASSSRGGAGAVGLADAINQAVSPVQGNGLLKRPKADARTRVRRKIVRGAVEDEPTEEEEAEAEEPKEVVKPARGGKKGKNVIPNNNSMQDERLNKPARPTRAAAQSKAQKPRRFHSSDDEDGQTGVEDVDEDDSLPEVPRLPSKSEPRRKGKSKALDEEEVHLIDKGDSKPKAKSMITPKKTNVDVVIRSPATNTRRKKPTPRDDGSDEQPEENTRKSKTSGKKTTTRSNRQVENTTPESEDEVEAPKSRRGHAKQVESRKDPGPKSHRRASTPSQPMDVDEQPSTSTAPPRRNAAAKAEQRLHNTLMPDLVNFEAQMKKSRTKGRKSGSSMGAFALETEQDEEAEHGTKRKKGREVDTEDAEEEAVRDEEKPKKKRRVSDQNDEIAPTAKTKVNGKQRAAVDSSATSTSNQVVLLTTQVTLRDDVTKALTKLGVSMTTRPSECTHLIVPHVVRTEKFLCALARAPFILTVKWANASAAAKQLLPEKDFLLSNEAPDEKYNVDLKATLKRARANQGKMLDGLTFYVTPKVSIDKKLLKNVVNACGGTVSLQSPTPRIIVSNPESRFVISCKEDQSIWRSIADQGYKIYTQELLLMGILKQEMEWENDEFLVRP